MAKRQGGTGAMMVTGLARQGSRLTCWLPVGVALGIAVYFALPEEPPWWLCVAIMGGVAVGLALLVGSRWVVAVTERAARWQLLGCCLGSAVCALGMGFLLAFAQARRQPPMPLLPLESMVVEGRLAALEPVIGRHVEGGASWRVTIKGAVFRSPWWEGMAPLSRSLVITLPAKDIPVVERMNPGEVVRVRALLRAPTAPSWPGGYDGQRAAWFSGRAGTGTALSPIERVDDAQADRGRWGAIRGQVARQIEHYLPGQVGAIAAAVLCGETGLISTQTRQDYAASGLAHLLAVAGLHLGFVMGFVFVLLRRGMSLSQRLSAHWPCREIALVASLGAGVAYVLLTGCHIPGLRALGMAGLGVVAFLLGRRVISLRGLALVALALEVASPVVVLDVSFQMSFAAVMALIAGYEPLRGVLARLGGYGARPVGRSWGQRPPWWRRMAVGVVMLVITSLLAGLATLPLSMAYLGAFQPWFVLANILAVPLMGLWVMPAGLIALALMPLGLSAVALRVMGWGIEVISWLARHVAVMPFASWPVPSFPAWDVGLFLLGLAVLCLWRGMACFCGLGMIGVALVLVWVVPRPVMVITTLEHALAVRQEGEMRLVEGRLGMPLVRQEVQRALGWQARGVGVPFCQAGICRVPLKAGQVILWRMLEGADEVMQPQQSQLCAHVALEVNVREQKPLCMAAQHVSIEDIKREGSWAVYDDGRGGVRLISARMWQGERLWVGPMGFHGVPPLPFAKAE